MTATPPNNPFLEPIDPYAPMLAGLNLTQIGPNSGDGDDN